MFARTIRPATRSLRAARAVRAYTPSPVVRAAPRTFQGVSATTEAEAEREGGQILLMVGGALGALVTVGSILAKQRKDRVHPSEPKEAEEEEEAEEEAAEEVAEESAVEQVTEAISAASDAALAAIESSVAAVDAELESLVSAAHAALGSSPAPVAAALPDPSEAASQGAFNEETGEINWDCPCLGGMAHGPCGEEFKAAFSCFVYSEQEPKGIDCVEKFKGMQECFRAHPDVYAEEIDDDEEAQAEAAAQENKE